MVVSLENDIRAAWGKIRDRVPQAERRAAQEWWAGLSDVARAELTMLLDPRADCCAFALECGKCGEGQWHALPVSVDKCESAQITSPWR